jgi:uncharacterized protein
MSNAPKNSTNLRNRREAIALGGTAGIAALIASYAATTQSGTGVQSASAAPTNAATDHPNVAIVKRYYDAYGKGDLATVRQIFAPNIIWRIPGHHSLAGEHRGQDRVFAFFEQLAKAKFKADVLFLGGNDSYVVDVHRGYSNMERDNIDILWALLFRIQNNRIVEATNFPGDQHAADAFYWRVYPLKPLPDRLA